MPIAVRNYFQFKGYAVAPEDISWGEAASNEVSINRGGTLTTSKLTRYTVQLTLRGLSESQASAFVTEAKANTRRLIRGSATLEDLQFGSKTLEQSVLITAVPSVSIAVAGVGIVEQLQLTYESQVFV